MAGPGKPGPPARGHEQVEYHHIEVKVIELLDQGFTKAQIAREIGYRNRSQGYRMIDRIMKRDLITAGRDRLRLLHFERLEGMYASLEPEVVKDDGTPVDAKMVAAAIKILEREARMTGIDGPAAKQDDEYGEWGEEGAGLVGTHPTVDWVENLTMFNTERDALGVPSARVHRGPDRVSDRRPSMECRSGP